MDTFRQDSARTAPGLAPDVDPHVGPDAAPGAASRSPAGPRGSYAKGRARRADIVDAALETFGRLGYRSASMVGIAERCGVSRAGLLHHFPTKEDLLRAVLEEHDRRNAERYFGAQGDDDVQGRAERVESDRADPGRDESTVLGVGGSADPGGGRGIDSGGDGSAGIGGTAGVDGLRFLSSMLALAGSLSDRPGLISLFVTLAGEAADPTHPAHDYFVRRQAVSRRRFQVALEDLGERGLLAEGVEAGGAALELVALVDGLQMRWVLDPARTPIAEVLRRRFEQITTVAIPAPG